MLNSVMILVSLTVDPSCLANFPKKANFLIEVFPFRGLLIGWGSLTAKSVDRCLQRGKVNGACEGRTPWNCWREPPSGLVPQKKSQATKDFH
jgi:hypothetical protein